MDSTNSIQQAESTTKAASKEVTFSWVFDQDSSNVIARKALRKLVYEIDTANAQRREKIEKLRFLLFELRSCQPAELTELCDYLGQSESTTRGQLKELVETDLVVKTVFEKHTLYCVNGYYNKFIDDWTNECFG